MGDCMKKTKTSTLILRVVFTTLTVLFVVFIFSNSFQTASVSSQSSARVLAFLNSVCEFINIKPFFTQKIVRTLAHFCEFGLLGVLSTITYLSYFAVKAKTLEFSLATVFCTALIDECIQLFSDGRAFQFSDIIIDVSGGLLGLVGTFLIAFLINNRKKYIKRDSNGKG